MPVQSQGKDMSLFHNRLEYLMNQQGIKSAPKLATLLVEKDLVSVNQGFYDDDSDERKNKIGSITKKVRKHLAEESVDRIQGEFIRAYSEFFNCSADFLLGYTPIKTKDPNVRYICETLGLSESVVCALMDSIGEGKINYCWNAILESDLFATLPYNWLIASGEYRSFKQALKKTADLDQNMDIILEKMSQKDSNFDAEFSKLMLKTTSDSAKKQAEHHYAAFNGMLNRITADVFRTLHNSTEKVFCSDTDQEDFQW